MRFSARRAAADDDDSTLQTLRRTKYNGTTYPGRALPSRHACHFAPFRIGSDVSWRMSEGAAAIRPREERETGSAWGEFEAGAKVSSF